MLLTIAATMLPTTIVSKLLTERLLEIEHGRRTIGILLFQDLALVPPLILVLALGEHGGSLLAMLALASFKVVLVLLLLIGQKLMRRWLQIVVRRHS